MSGDAVPARADGRSLKKRVTNPDSGVIIGEYRSRLCAIENFAGHRVQTDIRVRRYSESSDGQDSSPSREIGG